MADIKMPVTRYYGSKRKLIDKIWKVLESEHLKFNSVLDLFGGTGMFAFYAKHHGKQVTYNDIFKFNYHIGCKLIEQEQNNLTTEEAISLLKPKVGINYQTIIEENFDSIYFTNEENKMIDTFIQNANLLEDENKKLSAYYILYQSCIIKRPYNLFHRNNLSMRTNFNGGNFGNKITWERSFEELFSRFIRELDETCFSNGQSNLAINYNALECPYTADLVYIDPPYFSTSRNHTSYHSKYHFLEGLANYNDIKVNIDIMKSNREIIINKSSDFEKPKLFIEQLKQLLDLHMDSTIVLSYRNNGIPEIYEIEKAIIESRPGKRTKVVDLGLYNYALNKSNSTNSEYLIIAFND